MTFWKYFIAVLGGFRFGYAVAIMAGALLFIAPQFDLGPAEQGFVVSAILIGALVGSASGSLLAESLGRKRAQQLIALLFLIGSMLIISASSLEMIVIGRIIEGLAVGAVTVIGPMYMAEISPAQNRGRNVSCYQLAVTFGVLCAYFVSYLFSGSGSWKGMFAVSLIPTLAYGIGFFFMPESRVSNAEEPGSWKALFKPVHRSSLISALSINMFQQLSGINAVIYFAPSIFELCGFKSASLAIFGAVLVGAVNFLTTIASVLLIDRKGRKPLLYVGVVGMFVGLVSLALVCFSTVPGPKFTAGMATASLMLYIASFAIGMGPIPGLLASEVFPHSIRSRGMALSLVANWICNFLVVATFMDLIIHIGQSTTFFIYALFCLGALYFIWKKIPETNGRTL